MGVITVKELHKNLSRLIADGHGDKEIWITSDDEGNSYHALYYNATATLGNIMLVINLGMIDGNVDPNKIVLLG